MTTVRLDYVEGVRWCVWKGRFVNTSGTLPAFLEGRRVSRQTFEADIEEINSTISEETKFTRFYFAPPAGVAFWLGLVLIIAGIFTSSSMPLSPVTIVGFALFLAGFVLGICGTLKHKQQMDKLMSSLIPAKLNEMAARYGVTCNLEQTQVMTGKGTMHGYKIVITDNAPATAQVVGVGPPPAPYQPPAPVVVAAPVAGPPPSKFCTQCGAPLTADAKFCGRCGAATDVA